MFAKELKGLPYHWAWIVDFLAFSGWSTVERIAGSCHVREKRAQKILGKLVELGLVKQGGYEYRAVHSAYTNGLYNGY